jgi:hypothetical protein
VAEIDRQSDQRHQRYEEQAEQHGHVAGPVAVEATEQSRNVRAGCQAGPLSRRGGA